MKSFWVVGILGSGWREVERDERHLSASLIRGHRKCRGQMTFLFREDKLRYDGFQGIVKLKVMRL